MIDPWAPPTAAQMEHLRAQRLQVQRLGIAPPPWLKPSRMSLRSVPDARSAVPLRWWLPVVALVMLGTTTVAILPGVGSSTAVLVATAVSIAGYLLVWWRVRPSWLRVGPYAWPSTEGIAQSRTEPPTIAFPAVGVRRSTRWRNELLLLASAAVGLGSSVAWALLSNALLHPAAPAIHRARTVAGAFVRALTDAAITSILEECGIAVLILAVAAVAQQFLPARFDSRSVAVTAILAATVVRTVLHIPLWGVGAVARFGLSFALAWLFWRSRRIWPLITVHILWDVLALQAGITPSLSLRAWCSLAVFAWGITGVVFAVIATSHSKADMAAAALYYRRRNPQSRPDS